MPLFIVANSGHPRRALLVSVSRLIHYPRIPLFEFQYTASSLTIRDLAYLEFMTSLKKEEIERKCLPVIYWDVKKMKRKEDEGILKRSSGDVDIEDHCLESEEKTTDEDECMTVDMKKLFEEQFVGESTKHFDEPEAGDETENREGLNMNENVEKQGGHEDGDETENREWVNMNKNTEKQGGYEGDIFTDPKVLDFIDSLEWFIDDIELENSNTICKQNLNTSHAPSFSLGLTQEFQETNEGFREEKGKKMVNEEDNENSKEIEEDEDILTTENEEHTEKVSKRVIKPLVYLCSPYCNKNVSMHSFPKVDELKVSNRLFARTGHFSENIFETEKDIVVLRGMIETLQAGLWVHVNVIDAWSAVLNYEEKNRRYFFDTTILVFFPVHSANHYYLICINLKEPRVDVLDNKLSNAKMKNSYHGAPKRTFIDVF
ncbi:hypothetical protein L1887_36805 [Cichorium endivia]|nr:hypothetical protein L1887_36805 [Cichorium endivia]